MVGAAYGGCAGGKDERTGPDGGLGGAAGPLLGGGGYDESGGGPGATGPGAGGAKGPGAWLPGTSVV